LKDAIDGFNAKVDANKQTADTRNDLIMPQLRGLG